ncbi:protein rapunzel-like [Polypterus senegalus]|uniref:protein rapunzel-like n=1 Tax=Polypterus senegalus TaxID=55291 RepID=UPI001965EA09|nr:protein rapunzel-like [Polypterus senegalus]XP_039608861.1 protein rapunzel-like [Polypterus senegalus]
MSALQQLVAEKKEVVETVMDIFEQGAEIVASVVGEIFPIFQIAAPIVKLALDNVESKEAEFMKEQFQKVRDKLDVISEEITSINNEIKKSTMDSEYFSIEENLINQFRKFMDFLNAKPKFRETKKKLFLDHFNKSGGEKNLNILYDAVTGNRAFGEPILEIALNYEEKNRRVMEDFCDRLKKLFCIGLIVLMGHAALENEDEEELAKQWSEKIKDVEIRMKIVIDDCIGSFAEQAKIDIQRLLRDNNATNNKQMADLLLEFLKKKYNWVMWSVRVFNEPTGIFSKLCWKEYHCLTGKSRFDVLKVNDTVNISVSYSSSPEPLNKTQINQLMENQKKNDVKAISEEIFYNIPACVVHTIQNNKEVAVACSFPEELHFWQQYKNVVLCVHPS